MNVNDYKNDYINSSWGQKCQNKAIELVERPTGTGYTIINAVGGRLCGVVVKPLARIIDVVKHIFLTLAHLVFGTLATLKHLTIGRYFQLSEQSYCVTYGFIHLGLTNTFLWEIVPSLTNLIDPSIYGPDNRALEQQLVNVRALEEQLGNVTTERNAARANRDQFMTLAAENQTTINTITAERDHLQAQIGVGDRLNASLARTISTQNETHEQTRAQITAERDALRQQLQHLPNSQIPTQSSSPSKTPPPPPLPRDTPRAQISPARSTTPEREAEAEEIHTIAEQEVRAEGFQGLLQQIRAQKKKARPATVAGSSISVETEIPKALSDILSELGIYLEDLANYENMKNIWNSQLIKHFRNPTIEKGTYICTQETLNHCATNPNMAINMIAKLKNTIEELEILGQDLSPSPVSSDATLMQSTTTGLNSAIDDVNRIEIIAEKFGRLFRTLAFIKIVVAKNRPTNNPIDPAKQAKINAEKEKVKLEQLERETQFNKRFSDLQDLFTKVVNAHAKGNIHREQHIYNIIRNHIPEYLSLPNVKELEYPVLLKCLETIHKNSVFTDRFSNDLLLIESVIAEIYPGESSATNVAGPSTSADRPSSSGFTQGSVYADNIDWETQADNILDTLGSVEDVDVSGIAAAMIGQLPS